MCWFFFFFDSGAGDMDMGGMGGMGGMDFSVCF